MKAVEVGMRPDDFVRLLARIEGDIDPFLCRELPRLDPERVCPQMLEHLVGDRPPSDDKRMEYPGPVYRGAALRAFGNNDGDR